MSDQLNLTEVMTAVQNFITSDGQIIPAQRDFYRVLRDKMNNHTGLYIESEVELILLDARSDVLELTDDDYNAIRDVIMERFGLSKRLEEEERLREELISSSKSLNCIGSNSNPLTGYIKCSHCRAQTARLHHTE